MRAVIQRVSDACLSVDGSIVSQIGRGFVILLGIRDGDTQKDADYLIPRCAKLRIFEDENGKMNLSPQAVNGDFLVVSNFTLYGDTSHGKRPSFSDAARPETARPLYEYFSSRLAEESGLSVKNGIFGADMKIKMTADGPITIFMDTDSVVCP